MSLMSRNLDETIASNLRRLIEDRELTFADVADRLRVQRHLVYDMVRARPGRSQREFRWSELVALCSALGTTVFELVLPPEGESANLDWFAGGELRDRLKFYEWSDSSLDRDQMSRLLFAVSSPTPKQLEAMREEAKTTAERREGIVREFAEEILRRLEEE